MPDWITWAAGTIALFATMLAASTLPRVIADRRNRERQRMRHDRRNH